jgi:protein ImuB
MRLSRPELSGPFALAVRQANALRLTAVDAGAEAEGLHPGLSLADARARLPEVTVLPADPEADLLRLTALAEACRRYTPALAVDAPDGVLLDITGCAHLYASPGQAGEAGLMADLRRRVTGAGYSLRMAIADTPGLAWALARARSEDFAAPQGTGAALLEPMPLSALRLPEEQLRLLARLGLRRVGQLALAPRASLTRRLGRELLDRLDQALGRRASPLHVRLEVEPWQAVRRLLEPISHEDHILSVIKDLAADLQPRLDGEGKGARGFLLELFRLDGAIKRLEVAASRPLRDPGAIQSLFKERLAALNEGLEADYGFDQLRLSLRGVQALSLRTGDLAGAREEGEAFAALADRLAARFGEGAVQRFVEHPERRLPEEGARAEPWLKPQRKPLVALAPPAYEGAPLRPLRLFHPPQLIEVLAEIPEGPPERFRWRRLARRITCAEGPERIEPEWWRGPDFEAAGPRDYYRLEDEKGCRYWVFRQGLYTDPDPPRWYLQGLFA